MQSTKQAVFMLGEEEYSFDIMDVNTIEKVIAIEPVEGFSKNLKGIINLRGDKIPVYNLRSKFGMQDIPTDYDTRFIITSSNGILIAYEVDSMKEIVQLDENQLYETPALIKGHDTSYVKAITKVGDRMIIIMDHNGILSDEEQSEIKAVMNQ